MRNLLYLCTLFFITSCQSQGNEQKAGKLVGGPCEGCEAIFEYGTKILTDTDTLPGFEENQPKLKITGTVFQKDGKTPASDVILYIYQTNRKGIYETKGDEQGWAKRHGFIRGWIKTGEDGKYTFYTLRPASYPNRRAPEHIHITVKEPNKNEYYINDYVFSDDPLLTKTERGKLNNRGGSGIIILLSEGDLLLANRDIILGRNIPNYD